MTTMRKAHLIIIAILIAIAATTATTQQQTNINKATAAQLEALPGIGKVIAQRIIDNRPYVTVDELEAKVKGIGPKKMAQLRPLVTVGGGK